MGCDVKRINVFQRFDILCVSFAGAINAVKHKTVCNRHSISIIIMIKMSLYSEDYILSKIYLSNIWSSYT